MSARNISSFSTANPSRKAAKFSAGSTRPGRAVPKSDGIERQDQSILQDFDDTEPWKSVPALLELRQTLRRLGEDSWVKEKLGDLDQIIAACAGLHLEAVTEKPKAQPGEKLGFQIEAINRSPVKMKWQSMKILTGKPQSIGKALSPNELQTEKETFSLPNDTSVFRALLAARTGHGWNLQGIRPETDWPTGEPGAISNCVTIEIGDEEIATTSSRGFAKWIGLRAKSASRWSSRRLSSPSCRNRFLFSEVHSRKPSICGCRSVGKIQRQTCPGSSGRLEGAAGLCAGESRRCGSETNCSFQLTPPDFGGRGDFAGGLHFRFGQAHAGL